MIRAASRGSQRHSVSTLISIHPPLSLPERSGRFRYRRTDRRGAFLSLGVQSGFLLRRKLMKRTCGSIWGCVTLLMFMRCTSFLRRREKKRVLKVTNKQICNNLLLSIQTFTTFFLSQNRKEDILKLVTGTGPHSLL